MNPKTIESDIPNQFCLRVMEVLKDLGLIGGPKGIHTSGHSTLRGCHENGINRDNKEEHLFGEESVMPDTATKKENNSLTDNTRLIIFKQPEELQELLNFSLGNACEGHDQLLSLCESIIKHSVLTNDARFRNQLYGGMDPYGLAGSLIAECLNTSQYTYEVAPVFSLCEMSVMRALCDLVGWSEQQGEGINTPGASLANIYAVCLARFRLHPEVKQKGVSSIGRPMVIYASEESHYSILKAANWLGLGTECVALVACDDFGRMRPEHLQELIEANISEGKEPLVVVATAGTTVLGAFDPLLEISDICKQYNVWLHVDAAWGGAALFSRRHSHLLRGVENCDSFCWNPHKMLGAPLQCSLFVVKQRGLLIECNSARASYLFQQDKLYPSSYDTGDMAVQCGRKIDAFKIWLMWKARGTSGLGELVDRAFETAMYFSKRAVSLPGFRMVLGSDQCQCTNICFWYIPQILRNQPESEQWWRKVGRVAPLIKRQMMISGTLMVGYQPLQHRKLPNFFRLVFTCHPIPTEQTVEYILNEIDRLGSMLVMEDLENGL